MSNLLRAIVSSLVIIAVILLIIFLNPVLTEKHKQYTLVLIFEIVCGAFALFSLPFFIYDAYKERAKHSELNTTRLPAS